MVDEGFVAEVESLDDINDATRRFNDLLREMREQGYAGATVVVEPGRIAAQADVGGD